MKILLIDPHSGISSHFRQAIDFAAGLSEIGHQVKIMTCAKGMKFRCNVNEAFGRSHSFEAEFADCGRCVLNLEAYSSIARRYGISIVSAQELLAGSELALSEERREIEENLKVGLEFTSPVTGCPVSRLALYETYLKYKLSSAGPQAGEQKDFHLAYTLNANMMTRAAAKLQESFVPDAVVGYSPQYSAVGAAIYPFEADGVPVFFIEGSAALNERYSHIRLWDWSKHGLANPRMEDFHRAGFRGSLSSNDRERILGHFKVIERGASFSVYSPSKSRGPSPRKHFNIPSGSSVFLLCLSSSDEVRAAQVINRFNSPRTIPSVFSTQIEWLEETVAWFSKRSESYLIIRPHPRDFSTDREPVVAEHAAAISGVLAHLPDNVHVDHPDNPLPVWSYFDEVQGLITGWSSTALEAMFHSIPVITYDKNLTSFPASLSFTGSTLEEYWQNLELANNGFLEFDSEKAEAFYRWMSHNYFEHTIPLTPRILEKWRVRFRPVDKVLNGLAYFFPRVFAFIDSMKLDTGRAPRMAAETVIRVESLLRG